MNFERASEAVIHKVKVQQRHQTHQSNSVGKISGGKLHYKIIVKYVKNSSRLRTTAVFLRQNDIHQNQVKVKMKQNQKEISPLY